MTVLNNLKIAPKIIALLALLGLMSLSLAWYGARALEATDASYSTLVDAKLPSTMRLARMSRLSTEMLYGAYRTMAYDGASAEARQAEADEATAYASAKDELRILRTLRPDLSSELDQAEAAVERLNGIAGRAIGFGLHNENAAATQVLSTGDKELKALATSILAINQRAIADAGATSTKLTNNSNSTARFNLYLSLAAIGLAIGLGIWLVRFAITRPIAKLQETMEALAAGKNDIDVPGANRMDEIGSMAKAVLVFRDAAQAQEKAAAAKREADADQKMVVDTVSEHLDALAVGKLDRPIARDFPAGYVALKTNFNAAVTNLRELIATVTESAASIRTGAGEIAQASDDLARRTESNAASLEETAASISRMDERLKASAAAAGRTVERTDGAITTVQGGRVVADEAVAAMGRVADGAKGIDSVIEGLDKIAFQTRVLAMNAAVEAGRAGEAGRGFAVVADLVSALAMRSEEEAARARDQLTSTQIDIVTAVEAVQKVDGALSNISGDVEQVHTLVSSMADDNEAQSAAITQISAAVGSMDQATQQNAAMVEETSAAARNLSNEVGALNEHASRFDIGSARSHIATATAPKAPRQQWAGGQAPLMPPPQAIPPQVHSEAHWATF